VYGDEAAPAALQALLALGLRREVHRRAAELAAWEVAKQLETAITRAPGEPPQRAALGMTLAEGFAAQCAAAADALRGLAASQGSLEVLRGTEEEDEARREREEAEGHFRAAFAGLCRLVE